MEFPFAVAHKQPGKLAILRAAVKEIEATVEKHGELLPASSVAALLGMSRSRIYQLIDEGKVETVELFGNTLVVIASVEAWMESEAKVGRPVKLDHLKERGGCLKAAWAAGKAAVKK